MTAIRNGSNIDTLPTCENQSKQPGVASNAPQARDVEQGTEVCSIRLAWNQPGAFSGKLIFGTNLRPLFQMPRLEHNPEFFLDEGKRVFIGDILLHRGDPVLNFAV